MSNIFTLDNIEGFSEKINIDELYEKKKQSDLNKLEIFNKLLNRVHIRIKTISRQKIDNQTCWYLVPETIIGVPKYDQGACIAYLMDKLKVSGFNVRYIHPNLLFISWVHWVPEYVRAEIKKKTGVVLNEYGVKIDNEQDREQKLLTNMQPPGPPDYLLKNNEMDKNNQNKKDYTPIKSYVPSGNLLYDDTVLNKIKDKFI